MRYRSLCRTESEAISLLERNGTIPMVRYATLRNPLLRNKFTTVRSSGHSFDSAHHRKRRGQTHSAKPKHKQTQAPAPAQGHPTPVVPFPQNAKLRTCSCVFCALHCPAALSPDERQRRHTEFLLETATNLSSQLCCRAASGISADTHKSQGG